MCIVCIQYDQRRELIVCELTRKKSKNGKHIGIRLMDDAGAFPATCFSAMINIIVHYANERMEYISVIRFLPLNLNYTRRLKLIKLYVPCVL